MVTFAHVLFLMSAFAFFALGPSQRRAYWSAADGAVLPLAGWCVVIAGLLGAYLGLVAWRSRPLTATSRHPRGTHPTAPASVEMNPPEQQSEE